VKRQSGVALITAILIMALVTTLAYSLEWDNSLDLRRTYVSMYREEAIQAALGAESWMLMILRQDLQDSTTDHFGEIWASDIPPLPLESDSIQGEIFGQIEDLQGRFNINNLIDANGEVDADSLEQFQRLLGALGIDQRFAGIAADWLDADQIAEFPYGAEDAIYSGIVPPYRTANQIVSSASELAALEGMDKATFDTLLPHIVALPGRTRINVNTATGPVLQSLDENITVADVERLFAERAESGFDNYADAFSSLNLSTAAKNQIGDTTDFFRLKVIVRIDTVRITFFSVIMRGAHGNVSPILRSLGTT